MKLFLTGTRRITTCTPEMLIVNVGSNNDTKDGHTDATFSIEIKDIDFMKMSLNEIESLAIRRVNKVISQ